MPRRRKSRWVRFVQDRTNRPPLVGFVVTTILFILVVANLIVVAQSPTSVSPDAHPVLRWSLGRDADPGDTPEQHLEWGFSVDPGGRRVVDLDVRLPYEVSVTHHEGQARLSSLLVASVQGEQLSRVTRSITATPTDGNSSWTESHDLGERLDRLVVEREADSGPFVLLLALDWSLAQADPESTRFDVELGPVQVEMVQLGGLPGCTSLDCARVLFIGALVVQGGAVFWVMRRWHEDEEPKQQDGAGARSRGTSAPGQRTDKKK